MTQLMEMRNSLVPPLEEFELFDELLFSPAVVPRALVVGCGARGLGAGPAARGARVHTCLGPPTPARNAAPQQIARGRILASQPREHILNRGNCRWRTRRRGGVRRGPLAPVHVSIGATLAALAVVAGLLLVSYQIQTVCESLYL